MTIQQFIEKAIEGGWDKERARVSELDERDRHEGMATSMLSTDRMLLDPEAWKAVGKVEGLAGSGSGKPQEFINAGWLRHMHGLIDALAEGKTVEEYLETIV